MPASAGAATPAALLAVFDEWGRRFHPAGDLRAGVAALEQHARLEVRDHQIEAEIAYQRALVTGALAGGGFGA